MQNNKPIRRIRKYNQGGVSYTPFYQYFDNSQQSGKEDGGYEIDDQLSKMMEKGLTNDVQNFKSLITGSYSKVFDPISGTYVEPKLNSAQLVELQSIAKEVATNYELFNEAMDHLKTTKTLQESAISNSGNMYIIDEGGMLGEISIENFDRDKHRSVSYGELMNLRNNGVRVDTDLGKKDLMLYNKSVMIDAQNAIGINDVRKEIHSLLNNIEYNKRNTYSVKDRDKIRGGYEEIIKNGADGIYKITSLTPNAREAVRYLWSGLDENHKNRIRADIASRGEKVDQKSIAEELSMIISSDLKSEVTSILDVEASDAAGLLGGSSRESLTTNSVVQSMTRPLNAERTTVEIDPGDNAIKLPAFEKGPVVTREGAAIEQTTLGDILESKNSALGSVADRSSVFIGDKHLTIDDMNYIVPRDMTSKIVFLPSVPDENTGGYRIDFDVIERVEELKKFIKENPYATQLEINEKAKGLSGIYDFKNDVYLEGSGNLQMYHAINVYGNSEDLSEVGTTWLGNVKSDSKFIKQLEGDAEEEARRAFDRIMEKKEIDYSSGWFDSNHLVEGVAYVRVIPQLGEANSEKVYYDKRETQQRISARNNNTNIKSNFD